MRDIYCPVSMKNVAEKAGVSVMTVSRALRNAPRVSRQTHEKVWQMAEALGYRPNPLVSTLMVSRRRRYPLAMVQTIGFITSCSTRDGWRHSPIATAYFKGASRQALRLGFKLEPLWALEPGMTGSRLSAILLTHGIHGVGPLDVWNTNPNRRKPTGFQYCPKTFFMKRILKIWLKKNRPDAVLAGRAFIQYLVKRNGTGRRQIAIASLDYHSEMGRVAGIDQRNPAIGASAVDLIVEQLYHNQRGIPEIPKVVMIEGCWRNGATAPVASNTE